jgi:chromosome segregation ATPase
MPTELPEETPGDFDKKWQYRKPGEEKDTRPIPPLEEKTIETVDEPVEDESMDEDPTVEEPTMSKEEEFEHMKQENERLSAQISDLLEQVEEINAKKNSFEKEIETLTEQLDQANTDNAKFQEEISQHQKTIKAKTKQLDKMETDLAASKENIDNLNHALTKQEKTAKEREEQLMVQLESMSEQIVKLRGVIKKRDDELISLQKDILSKKEQAEGAQEEADKLRTVGIVQREAVQDTTVLRRRVNDLEVELDQLRRALEKDPKYRIYLLVRETGQRTLEELSKVLGVGVFEARRRVQELVRGGLLELQKEKVTISRRK